jgi:hypothetical protein
MPFKLAMLLICFLLSHALYAQRHQLLITNGIETLKLDSVTEIEARFFATQNIRLISANPANAEQKFSISIVANEVERLEYIVGGGNFAFKENHVDQFIYPNNTLITIGEEDETRMYYTVIKVIP